MKKLIFISTLLFLCVLGTQAQEKTQDEAKFHLILDQKFMVSLYETGDAGNFSRSEIDADGVSLRLSGVYSFLPRLTAGIGIGAEAHSHGSFPVFATIHYKLFKNNSFFLFGNGGYAFKTENTVSGLLAEAGLGYKKMFKKHFGLNFHIGYHLKQFNLDIHEYTVSDDNPFIINIETRPGTQTRHSLSFGIGLIF